MDFVGKIDGVLLYGTVGIPAACRQSKMQLVWLNGASTAAVHCSTHPLSDGNISSVSSTFGAIIKAEYEQRRKKKKKKRNKNNTAERASPGYGENFVQRDVSTCASSSGSKITNLRGSLAIYPCSGW